MKLRLICSIVSPEILEALSKVTKDLSASHKKEWKAGFSSIASNSAVNLSKNCNSPLKPRD